MPWSTSTRRSDLPSDWPAIRRRVLARDRHTCQACGARANEVDHIADRLDHAMPNLRSLCFPCHRRKTVAEAHESMRQQRAKAKHPVEQHPGLRRAAK